MANKLTQRHATKKDATASSQPNAQKKDMVKQNIGFVYRPLFCKSVAIGLLLYYVMMMIVRYNHRGVYAFADTLWVCNLNILLASAALLFGSPALLGATMVSVFTIHCLWVIDVIVWLLYGVFPIGNAAYIAWPSTSWLEIVSSTHHAWFVPLCLTLLHKNGGLGQKSFWMSVLSISPVLFASFFLPKEVMLESGELYYLNVNMAHGWWKDMDFWPFTLIPGNNPEYLIFLHVLTATKFAVAFFVLKLIAKLCLKEK
jgi:hypothetical protein